METDSSKNVSQMLSLNVGQGQDWGTSPQPHHNYTGNSSLQADFSDPLQRPFLQVALVTLYSTVFVISIFGNCLVLYTIGSNKSMRTRTNYFLANLALADLGVGVVCVMPKMSHYLTPHWVLGKAMCKIYYFANSLTYSASILLLTAIAMERYIAVLHPMRSKYLITNKRLLLAQLMIWLVSAAYSCPELTMYNLVYTPLGDGSSVAFCYPTKPYANMRDYYTINFSLLYILPLSVMSYMYVRVCLTLWRSSKPVARNIQNGAVLRRSAVPGALLEISEDSAPSNDTNKTCLKEYSGHVQLLDKRRSKQFKSSMEGSRSQDPLMFSRLSKSGKNASLATHQHQAYDQFQQRQRQCCHQELHRNPDLQRGRRSASVISDFSASTRVTAPPVFRQSISSSHVRNSRRRVIRLLLAVLLTFAVCCFPLHLKNLIYNWHPDPGASLDFLTPFSYAIYYANSALNPILYCFLSKSFRKCFKESIGRTCNCKRLLRHKSRHVVT